MKMTSVHGKWRGVSHLTDTTGASLSVLTMLGATDVGGENAPDHVRGPYNEGGWLFERTGALFEFDISVIDSEHVPHIRRASPWI